MNVHTCILTFLNIEKSCRRAFDTLEDPLSAPPSWKITIYWIHCVLKTIKQTSYRPIDKKCRMGPPGVENKTNWQRRLHVTAESLCSWSWRRTASKTTSNNIKHGARVMGGYDYYLCGREQIHALFYIQIPIYSFSFSFKQTSLW